MNAASVVLVLALALFAPALATVPAPAGAGPSLRTVNGTLTMKIAGASLTLAADSPSSQCGPESGTVALLSDVSQAAAGLQVQVTNTQSTITSFTANLTAAFLLAQQGQIDGVRSSASAASSKVDLLSAATASLSVGVGARVDGLSMATATALSLLAGRADALSSGVASVAAALPLKADVWALSSASASLSSRTEGLSGALASTALGLGGRVESLSAAVAGLSLNASQASSNMQLVSVSAAVRALNDSTTASLNQLQSSTSASVASILANMSSLLAGQASLSTVVGNVSTSLQRLQSLHAADISAVRASMLSDQANRTAEGAIASGRLDVLEQQVAAASTRAATLEARVNVLANTSALMQACLASGRAMDAQGRCIPTAVDFCVCPVLARVRTVCVAASGRTANYSCDPGFVLNGTTFPTCTNGQWSGPFPTCSGLPVFAPQAFGIYDVERSSKTLQITAAEPDGTPLTFTLVSGTLPPSLTLLSSGLITGTATAVAVATTTSFVVRTTTLVGLSANATVNITRFPPTKQTFAYTGADQVFAVPSGLTRFGAKLWGAGGGCQELDSTLAGGGGSGGFVSGIFAVASGVTAYTVVVGQGGLSGQTLNNGGGGAGGGLAGIFTGGGVVLDTDRARAVAIAGGGGGESDNNNEFAGAGGGLSGGGGQGGFTTGGTPVSAGGPLAPNAFTMRGRDCDPPSAGGGSLITQYGFGGRSWQNAVEVPNGAGGAGYYGGGSGATPSLFISGAGGSGYMSPAALVTGFMVPGALGGVPSAPALADADYPGASVSYGGRQSVQQGQNGFPGFAVIFY